MWRPFKPASYNSYGECMRALYRQGTPAAFYKGNLVRSTHILLFHKLNTSLTFAAEGTFGKQWKNLKEIPIIPELLLSCSVDLLLQPLHVAETRFTIQNRTKSFAAYPSIGSYFKNTPLRDMIRGSMVHLPRNFLIALSGLKI